MKRRVLGLGMFLAVACSAVFVATLQAAPPAVQAEDAGAILSLQDRIEKVAEDVGKSVVSITTMGKIPEGNGDLDIPWEMLPPEWRKRFQEPQPKQRRQPSGELVPRGLGSGVIISPEGFILTNQHVIAEAEKIEVTLSDRRKFPATVVGQDMRADLAVLKVDVKNLPAVKLDGSIQVKRGMFVLAIGNPFGFGADGQASVSFGIVSGLNRSLPMGLGEGEDRYYGRLIQTDAAINPGNSGGPLCDLDGKVIGIDVAIASRSGGNQGVAFAIPMDSPTLDIIERLKKGETIEYGYLGVMIRNPSELESKTAGAEPNTGAFVHTVEPSGPAHKAGVMEADMIVAIDGKPVKDSDDMVTSVGRMPVGKEVALTIYRSGKKMELKAPVGRRPGGKVASTGGRKGKPVPAGSFEWRGLTLRELTPEVRGEAEAGKEAAGVYVDRVDEKSGAYERGIHGGMIIDQVASIKVKNLEEFKKAVEKIKGPVFVNVIGQGPLVVPEE